MNLKKCLAILSLILFAVLPFLLTTAYASSDALIATREVSVPVIIENQGEFSNSNRNNLSSQKGPISDFNIVQIITSFGVIATAILGVANLITSVRQIHINGVNNKRAQWIESVREITANIVCYDLRKVDNKEQFEEEYDEFVKNAYKLSLYLNIQGAFDRVVSDYLIEFVKSQRMKSNDFANNRRMLTLAVQIYLKSEWNRVKHESKIIPFKKFSEKKSIANILGTLEGGYVDELRKKYEGYLNGGKMDAPVFFEFVELEFEPPIRF